LKRGKAELVYPKAATFHQWGMNVVGGRWGLSQHPGAWGGSGGGSNPLNKIGGEKGRKRVLKSQGKLQLGAAQDAPGGGVWGRKGSYHEKKTKPGNLGGFLGVLQIGWGSKSYGRGWAKRKANGAGLKKRMSRNGGWLRDK